jgi:hypothetical protein
MSWTIVVDDRWDPTRCGKPSTLASNVSVVLDLDTVEQAAAAHIIETKADVSHYDAVRISSAQNAASSDTSPSTPTWYAETRRSKKFVTSCTSCSARKPNGFLAPYCLERPSVARRWSAQNSR